MRYTLPALFFCFISFSQTKDSIPNKNAKIISNFSFKLDSLSKIKPQINTIFEVGNEALFSVYNRNTKLNDCFIVSKDTSYYVKSVKIIPNLFIQKDSFNPNGVSNVGAGLIMGSLNTVFTILFK
jgi:hypothetical protein